MGSEKLYLRDEVYLGLQYDENSVQLQECNKMTEACRNLGVSTEAMYGRKTFDLT
jgi:hypothetical protein